MAAVVGTLAAAGLLGIGYYFGNQIGRCDGFEEGMDAAIKVYEEVIREEAIKT